MIALTDVSKSFGGRRVLERVSLTLPAGSVTALVGRSGAGKTTLARILLGLEAPDAGRVDGLDGIKRAAVFQEDRLIEHMSALQNLVLVGASVEAARTHLNALGLADDMEVRVDRLSGGMRRRVALARAMIVGAGLIVLDEPMTGLDEDLKRQAAAYVSQNRGRAAVLLISHDPEDIQRLGADAIFSLDAPYDAT